LYLYSLNFLQRMRQDNHTGMGPVQYKNRKFRIAAAFAGSLFIIVYGKPFDFHKAAVSPGFYLVLAISFSAALLLVEFVHFMTVKLDGRFGWRSMFPERLFLQVIYCILVPASVDLLLFSIYFNALGQSIFENGFFHIDLPVVTGMLIVLSFYYCLRYWMLTDSRNVERQLQLAKMAHKGIAQGSEIETLPVEQKGEHINLKTGNILYFYRFGKYIKLVTLHGEEYQIRETISSLAERLSETQFVQINRSVILNFKAVKGYRNGSKRYTLELLFKNKYATVLREPIDEFLVTKEHIATIKDRYREL